jgi:ABC-2 type transport system ATP-binding protein
VEFGELAALREVSLELEGGQLLGLIGPNGAGKTTLLRTMAGLQEQTCGRVEIHGSERLLTPDERRALIGFAPDSPPAYEELSVEEFLMFVADAHRLAPSEASERVDYWLEQTWLAQKRRAKIKTLSRGMRQRVTLAQVLLPNPIVVLLDEPSSGLDPAGRIELRRIIASLPRQGKAVIVSSHILADLEDYCTHIAILEHGRLLRYSHVDHLTGHAPQRCTYTLRTAASEAETTTVLAAIDGVNDVQADNNTCTFTYLNDEGAAARLLRQLIDRGLSIASFSPQRETLEDVYLQAGLKQVD